MVLNKPKTKSKKVYSLPKNRPDFLFKSGENIVYEICGNLFTIRLKGEVVHHDIITEAAKILFINKQKEKLKKIDFSQKKYQFYFKKR